MKYKITILELLEGILGESGWNEALVKAKTAQFGTVDTLLKGAHVG